MKHSAVSFLLLFSSLTLAAQSRVKPEAPTLVFKGNAAGSGCPIEMRATQGVWDRTIKVRQGNQEQVTQPFGQRIFLSLQDSHSDPIVAATVRVHGLTGKNRVLQTGEADGDGMRVMRLTFGSTGTGSVSGDLHIPGFTAVSSIDLIEVSYGNGKIWTIGSECRVTPDPMMLITTR